MSGGKLSLLTSGGTSHTIARPGRASEPQWSHDGAWLAYVLAPSASVPPVVHAVRADGTADHILPGVQPSFAWSPTAEVLAFVGVGGAGLSVAPVDGTPTELVKAGNGTIDTFLWSPDGAALAYGVRPSSSLTASDQLFSVSAEGGRFQRWAYKPSDSAGIVLAGWWPDGRGLLLWIDPDHSSSVAADGLPLVSVPVGAEKAMDLVTTLPYRPWLAWSPDGSRLLVVAGDDREPSVGKELAVCRPAAGSCASLPGPPATVALDPAWSTDGKHVAFVRAPTLSASGGSHDFTSWYPSRRLWVAAPDGSGAREVQGAGPGVAAPAWSLDGRTLLYSTAADIRSVPVTGGVSRRLAGPLTGGGGSDWANIGKQPWAGVAVWVPPLSPA